MPDVDRLRHVVFFRARERADVNRVFAGLSILEDNPHADVISVRLNTHDDALSEHDVTDIYTKARRKVFDTCARVVVHAPPGAVILVHRLALHGVAPWQKGATADPAGRLIAYFRPQMPGGVKPWLELP